MHLLIGLLIGLVSVVVALIGVGCCSFSSPVYHGPVSDHFDGRRFRNLDSTERKEWFSFLKWITSRDSGPWRPYTEIPRQPIPATRLEGRRLQVTWINHSSVLIQTGGVNILTDPVYSERVSPLLWIGPKRAIPPGIRFEDLPPIDTILISHGHYDHLDLPTLERIWRRDRPRIVVPLGIKAILKIKDIPAVELDWWQSTLIHPEIRVVAVPAKHFSNRGLCDRNRTLWAGYVIESAGGIYFAGDTGFGRHFEMIQARFGSFRLALLPIGAFRPEWFMLPVHLSPRQALEAQEILDAETAVGIHYGTFRLADDAQDEPVIKLHETLAKTGKTRTFLTLEPGKSFYIDQPK